MSQKLRTPKEAKEWLESLGVSVIQFARAIKVDRMAVYNALRGQGRGKRGSSHVAAIALGIKARPDGMPAFTMTEILSGQALKHAWMAAFDADSDAEPAKVSGVQPTHHAANSA